jgi:hypothetical protein
MVLDEYVAHYNQYRPHLASGFRSVSRAAEVVGAAARRCGVIGSYGHGGTVDTSEGAKRPASNMLVSAPLHLAQESSDCPCGPHFCR